MTALLLALVPGCGCLEAILQDYGRDLLVAGLLSAVVFNQRQPLAPGDAGTGQAVPLAGIDCWDLNRNRIPEPAEDINADGVFDARDCQGEAGPPGQSGTDGMVGGAGQPGAAGRDGADGINCWDTNANGLADDAEDLNGDGLWNARDCIGPAGARGAGGSPGPTGTDGMNLFDVAVVDFFTADPASTDRSSVQLLPVEESFLTPQQTGQQLGPLAFRFAVPENYNVENEILMRLYLHRAGPGPVGCVVLAIDARRLRPGLGIRPFDHDAPEQIEMCSLSPASPGCGRRWVRIDAAAAIEEGDGKDHDDGILLVVDLPLSTPSGLDYPDELTVSDFLAFELTTAASDGASYELLGVEFQELRPGHSVLVGAAVLTPSGADPNPTALCSSATVD